MIELTLLLIVLAVLFYFLFRKPTRARRAQAEEAARRAVERRVAERDRRA